MLLSLIGTPLVAQRSPPSGPAAALHALFDAEWDYTMEQRPTWASQLGDRRGNDRWEDVSLAAFERRFEHNQEVLSRLRGISRGELSAADRLNHELFEKQYETAVEEHSWRWHLLPLNQRGGIQTADEIADALRFETLKDYEDWIARLRAFPTYMEQTIELMREGVRARMVHAKVVMERVPAQIDKQIVAEPGLSPFFKPFEKFPDTIAESEQDRLRESAKEAIAAGVIPAFRGFKKFFNGEYLPGCFDSAGAWQHPDGEALYAFFARKHTSTKLTPREIHETGLREVERLKGRMEAIKEEIGFRGTLQEFFEFVRTEPRFHHESPDELLEAYRALAKRIDPLLVKVFKTLPRMPYGVEPIPENIAPDTTTAYYRPPAADGSRAGTFFVNLYKPETRLTFEMTALALHEGMPGHHLQIALAFEQGDIPKFRRHGSYTSFVEGWGLYAEKLGYEMGLYEDPLPRFGQLTYEMWRAVRLVVDTGIHARRWDRQKAIDYFLEHAAKSELDVVNEVDRYISWPGQALAYKIGELKIQELRARAQKALGDRFDLREFHEVVLKSGPVPLDILEREVTDWIFGQLLRR